MGGATSAIIDFLTQRWTELGSLLLALAYGRLHCNRTGHAYISRDTGLSILHGLALFPLCLLALAPFIPIQILFQSEKLIYSGAAIVAIFSMLENRPQVKS
jgi:hypothetical protein